MKMLQKLQKGIEEMIDKRKFGRCFYGDESL